jgi:hypothetical protein
VDVVGQEPGLVACTKRLLFSTFPMFVPSLSWQNGWLDAKMAHKRVRVAFAPVQQGGVCISLRFQRREMLAPYLLRMRITFVLKTAETSIALKFTAVLTEVEPFLIPQRR